jgi:hypothetical protein
MSITQVSSSLKPISAEISKQAPSILFRIQELVCRITTQLSRMSEETRTDSKRMKKEYQESSAISVSMQRKIGLMAPSIGAVSFLITLSGQIPSKSWKELHPLITQCYTEYLPPIISSLGNAYATGVLSANQIKAQSVSSLRQTELGNEGQKSGEAQNLQSALQSIFDAARELYRKAAG